MNIFNVSYVVVTTSIPSNVYFMSKSCGELVSTHASTKLSACVVKQRAKDDAIWLRSHFCTAVAKKIAFVYLVECDESLPPMDTYASATFYESGGGDGMDVYEACDKVSVSESEIESYCTFSYIRYILHREIFEA